MAKEKELKDQRIPIMMSETELSAIDDWSFKNRIRSRGEAIRRLCQIGLASDEARRDESFRAKATAAIHKLDHVLDDVVREVVRAMQEGEISETETVRDRITEAKRQLDDLLNARVLGNG
ncbi:UNVERIFIED_ORG: metal-responsive CopG/Arc/MetJ family transcriptional regulator [Rhizobium esperanzae]